jgi:hypothetical protein
MPPKVLSSQRKSFVISKNRISLVGYTSDYFLPFGQELETAGIEVFWINALKSDSTRLQTAGIPNSRWLDTNADFRPHQMDLDNCRQGLANLERAVEGPRIYNIIMMDRILRKKPTDFAIRYLAHLEKTVSSYLIQHSIELVTSGRDTALQILTMMICRRLGIPWVVPTRARIPQEMYGFCKQHDTDSLISFRAVTAEDRVWGAACLEQFRSGALKPALKKSARSFSDVLKLMPYQAHIFVSKIRKAGTDKSNDYARNTLFNMMTKYVRRRLNMLTYKISPPYAPPGNESFALYALHTQPESSIDVVGAYFSDQVDLVRTIARSLPINHKLYVKIHPTDIDGQKASFYRELAAIPGVQLIGHQISSRDLLLKASLVFSLSGTIAYEAGLLGIPVIVFARNYFNALPTIHYCSSPPELPSLIAKVLVNEVSKDLDDQLIGFLAQLRTCCFDGEVNRTYGASSLPLSTADLSALRQAYKYLVQRARDGWSV